MKKTLPKGISRLDVYKNNIHAYISRVCHNNRVYERLFYDGTYGDKESSLFAAIQWRDEVEKKFGKPRTERRVVSSRVKTNTGVMGVSRKKIRGMDVYEVRWTAEPYKSKKTTVSVSKYGEKEAFKRAVDLRKKKEEKYFGLKINGE